MIRRLGWILAVAWLVLGWPPADVPSRTVAADDAESSGEVWADTTWVDLQGRQWTREALQGKVVVLDFWATWCLPCLAELPNLRQLSRRFAEDDVVLLGVALDSMERRRLRSFVARHDISWPQIHHPLGFGSEPARQFGIETLPATVLVDRQGRVVARDLRGEALEVTVQMLLDLPNPERDPL